ncbi:MAG: metal-sensitive transcriptional regulator [Weeksellaceae bacterium]
MVTHNKQKAQKLIKQAQGTLNKVVQMVEDDVYCPEIIQQADSVMGLLHKARLELLAGHLDHCLQEKLQKDKKSTIEELLKIYKLST